MDEPMNSFVFGEKDELFKYRMVGEHATQSGEGPLGTAPLTCDSRIANARSCLATQMQGSSSWYADLFRHQDPAQRGLHNLCRSSRTRF